MHQHSEAEGLAEDLFVPGLVIYLCCEPTNSPTRIHAYSLITMTRITPDHALITP